MPTDASKTQAAVWVPILLSIFTLVGGAVGFFVGEYKEHQQSVTITKNKKIEDNQKLLSNFLVKIEAKLTDNQNLYNQLRNDLEDEKGLLESYLTKAKKEGHSKHVLMATKITRLANKNIEIVELLEGYEPHIMHEALKEQSAEFRDHARTYSDRWAVIPKLVEEDGVLPTWKVFPVKFPLAIVKEIKLRKNLKFE